MRGPQDGDWVRAAEDRRDGAAVEGVLRLRHVPVLDYVQVLVVSDAGHYFVDPASIEVVRAGIAVVGNADLGDPLQADAGWRRITDLDSAIAEGLVHPARERAGGSWADLHDRLEGLVAAELSLDCDLYNAATSTAVTSGINAKDAICLALAGTTAKSETHTDARGATRRWPGHEVPGHNAEPAPKAEEQVAVSAARRGPHRCNEG